MSEHYPYWTNEIYIKHLRFRENGLQSLKSNEWDIFEQDINNINCMMSQLVANYLYKLGDLE